MLLSKLSIEMYKSIIENNPDAIFILGVDGTIMDVNQVVTEILGYTKEEAQGIHYQEILVPECVEPMNQQFAKILQGISCNYETQVVHKNGKSKYLQVKSVPLMVNGEIVGIFGVAKDMTELHKTKASLYQMEERSKALFNSTGDVIHFLDLDGNVVDINPAFEKFFGWKREELIGKSLPTIPPSCLQEYENIMQRAKLGEPINGLETIRVKKDGTPIEVSGTYSIIRDTDGNVVGTAGITRDITKQKQLERDLKKGEKSYRKVVEFSPKGIVIHRDGTILYANPSALNIVKEDNLVGKSIFAYFQSDFHQIIKKRVAQSKIGKEMPIIEEKVILKDGEVIYAEIGGIGINYEGSPATLVIISDISERKKAEKALKESKERYQGLVNISPEPIIVHSQGMIKYINQAGVEVFGCNDFKELLGKSIFDFIHPDARKTAIERIQHLQQGELSKLELVEQTMIRLDGTVFNAEVTAIGMTYEGEPAIQVMLRDITTRKKAEEALRQSEEKYRLIAENMTDLVCVVDWDGYFKYASPSHATVLGFPSHAYKGNRARDCVHKDDFPKVWTHLEEMVKRKEGRIFEFRFRDVNGNWIWLEAKATPVFDEKCHFKHFLLVSREISERKMFEEKLSYMAFHDPLTGLPNRRLFKERLEQAIKEAERYGCKIAVMYMDMDKFKHINDALGHDVGDKLLKQFSNRVQSCLRESDILARQGGDEFIILLSEIQEEKDGELIASRILSSLQEPFHLGEHVIKTTSSIGIAFYPHDGMTRHELMNHADTALYEAKENGRNNFKTYSSLSEVSYTVVSEF